MSAVNGRDLEGAMAAEGASSIVVTSRLDQVANFAKNNKKAVAGALGLLLVGLVAIIAVAVSGNSSGNGDSALSSPSASISLTDTVCSVENDLVVVKGLPAEVLLYAKRSDTEAVMEVPQGDLFFWTGSSEQIIISFYTEESATDANFIGAVECQTSSSSESDNGSGNDDESNNDNGNGNGNSNSNSNGNGDDSGNIEDDDFEFGNGGYGNNDLEYSA